MISVPISAGLLELIYALLLQNSEKQQYKEL